MNIAICSQGPYLDSPVDQRFGRCAYFIIINPDSGEFAAEANPGVHAAGGAGVQAVQFLGDKGVDAVLAGNVGPKAAAALSAGRIKVYGGINGTVAESIELYRQGKLQLVSESTVPSHFGLGQERGRGKR